MPLLAASNTSRASKVVSMYPLNGGSRLGGGGEGLVIVRRLFEGRVRVRERDRVKGGSAVIGDEEEGLVDRVRCRVVGDATTR